MGELGALLSWKSVQIGLTWALLATALALLSIIDSKGIAVHGDDAMRLVGAVDFFNGQSWFDTMQHRDNAPFGAPMHWSRLIDLPLAGLMALFTPFAHEAAPYWAAFVWPLLVLLPVIILLVELTERLAGPTARLPALVLLAMAIAIYTEFVPGRVDHHNVQMALTLAMMLCSIQGRASVKWAIAAGLVAATGIAIGTEILPSVFATLACFALYWMIDPRLSRRQFLAFALSFGGGLALHQLIASPPQAWLASACDALSATYVTAGLLYIGVAFAAVGLGALLHHPAQRVVALVLLAAFAAGILLWLFPECRFGPYGNLEQDLASVLFPEIGEAQPVWIWASQQRAQIALLILPLLGMVAVLVVPFLAPAQTRWRWIVAAGFCLALFVVFCLQVRGFRQLSVAILPAPAWLVAHIWSWFRARQNLTSAAVAGLTVLAFSGIAHWSIMNRAYDLVAPQRLSTEISSMSACREPEEFEKLAALPPGNIMSFLLIGPQLLLNTPHSIVSAGYHRNKAGLRDMIGFYSGNEAQAREIARSRSLDYLVFCRGVSPTRALAGLDDFKGLSWSWLSPLSAPDDTLQIYAMTP